MVVKSANEITSERLLNLILRAQKFRSTQFAARGKGEGYLTAHRNSDPFKGGNKMKPSTKDEVAGKVHEVKGKVKEKAGQLTNNPDLKGEGQDEKIGGKVQKKIGQVEKVFGK